MIIYTPPPAGANIGSGSEDIVIINGPTHTYDLSAGDTLLLVLLYDADTSVDLGITPGGTEVFAATAVVDGFAAEHLTYYTATDETLYFTGLSSGSVIKLKIISNPVIAP